jgi:hypothetical protein
MHIYFDELHSTKDKIKSNNNSANVFIILILVLDALLLKNDFLFLKFRN